MLRWEHREADTGKKGNRWTGGRLMLGRGRNKFDLGRGMRWLGSRIGWRIVWGIRRDWKRHGRILGMFFLSVP